MLYDLDLIPSKRNKLYILWLLNSRGQNFELRKSQPKREDQPPATTSTWRNSEVSETLIPTIKISLYLFLNWGQLIAGRCRPCQRNQYSDFCHRTHPHRNMPHPVHPQAVRLLRPPGVLLGTFGSISSPKQRFFGLGIRDLALARRVLQLYQVQVSFTTKIFI